MCRTNLQLAGNREQHCAFNNTPLENHLTFFFVFCIQYYYCCIESLLLKVLCFVTNPYDWIKQGGKWITLNLISGAYNVIKVHFFFFVYGITAFNTINSIKIKFTICRKLQQVLKFEAQISLKQVLLFGNYQLQNNRVFSKERCLQRLRLFTWLV